MPLHDWNKTVGWEGVHLIWMIELLRHIKPDLPSGFRAYLGSGSALAIGAPAVRPDLSVRAVVQPEVPFTELAVSATTSEPDIEVAVMTLDKEPSLLIEREGRLVAAVELISPRNKDRPASRMNYGSRYAGYLMEGVNVLLIDVHPRPSNFSFANFIATELEIPNQPMLPPPMAISYRVGEPAATGGRLLAIWRYSLKADENLPKVMLALDVHRSITVDLESTYDRAAKDAYL